MQQSITARNLSIGYPKTNHSKQKTLYTNLNFELREGELTCLLGPNGAGKSTLLRTLSALQSPLGGNILFFEKELKEYTEQQLATLLGLVLTDRTTVGGLKVSELVGLGRYPYTGFFGKLNAHDHQQIEQAMNDVGILHKAENYVAELSDGERQKVMIAKALTQECPIILLDEPTAFLDVSSRIEIMILLRRLAIDQHKTILLSTHDIELALSLSDRLCLLARDKGLLCGLTEDVVLSDAMTSYFGRNSIYFDKQIGSFVPQLGGSKYAQLLSATGVLAHWMQNLLARNGYQLTDDLRVSSFTITISAPDKIKCEKGELTNTFTSFEQVNNWIKKL